MSRPDVLTILLRHAWPDTRTPHGARRAGRQGLVVLAVLAAFFVYAAFFAPPSPNAYELNPAERGGATVLNWLVFSLFGIAAWRIVRGGAVVTALVLMLMMLALTLWTAADTAYIVWQALRYGYSPELALVPYLAGPIILSCLAVNGLRGASAQKRLHRSVDDTKSL